MPFPRKKIAVSLLPQQLREHSYAVIYPPGNRIVDLYIMPDAMLGGIQSGKKSRSRRTAMGRWAKGLFQYYRRPAKLLDIRRQRHMIRPYGIPILLIRHKYNDIWSLFHIITTI
jgi:hypothetical protein